MKIPAQFYQRRTAAGLAAAVFLCFSAAAPAADQLRIWTEKAPTPAGPWTTVDPAGKATDGAGNFLLPADAGGAYFRTRIERFAGGETDPVPVAELPDEVQKRALRYLQHSTVPGSDSPDAWPDDAEIGPLASLVFDPSVGDGKIPAFVEMKVQRRAQPPAPAPAVLPRSAEDTAACDLGFIVLSLHDGAPPVPQSAQRGLTMTEQLQRMAGKKRLRVVRFGADLWVAEDESGKPAANLGSKPFKVDPSLVTTLTEPKIWKDDDETGAEVRPASLPAVQLAPYQTYEELKADWISNPVYIKLRDQLRNAVHSEWNIERGIYPEIIRLAVGGSQTLLPGRVIKGWNWVSEAEGDPLRITKPAAGGGLNIFGGAPGYGTIDIVADDGMHFFAVSVGDPAAAAQGKTFVPGYQPPEDWWADSEGYDRQPKYGQLKRDNWCPFCGCGPNAWMTLFAWYERERSVPAAFEGFTSFTAPPDSDSSGNRAKLYPALDKLVPYCAVICFKPFSDQGATLPGDMLDGYKQYTDPARTAGYLKRSSSHEWAGLFSTLGTGGPAIRKCVKEGRATVIGMGNYWHYGVAYGYRYQEFKIAENDPPYKIYRNFRVNMCWGVDSSPQWRSYWDVFYDTNVKLWNGPKAS